MNNKTLLIGALVIGGLYLYSRSQAQAATRAGLPAGAMNPQGFAYNPNGWWADPAAMLLYGAAGQIMGQGDTGTGYPTGAGNPQGFPSPSPA